MTEQLEGCRVPESQRPPRKQNPFCEFNICKHCDQEIGHRPYTRDWEHLVKCSCEKPFPKKGMCMCEECDTQ